MACELRVTFTTRYSSPFPDPILAGDSVALARSTLRLAVGELLGLQLLAFRDLLGELGTEWQDLEWESNSCTLHHKNNNITK